MSVRFERRMKQSSVHVASSIARISMEQVGSNSEQNSEFIRLIIAHIYSFYIIKYDKSIGDLFDTNHGFKLARTVKQFTT